jgi:hypothetical protein
VIARAGMDGLGGCGCRRMHPRRGGGTLPRRLSPIIILGHPRKFTDSVANNPHAGLVLVSGVVGKKFGEMG